MSHYSNKANLVRVDFFKESGKWYTTEEMEWLHYSGDIHSIFLQSLRKAFVKADGHVYYEGMTAVCLQPYHEHEHPLMRHNWNVE